ncbi:VanW family protein [Prauserella halophila]|uniref:VanW family protein n=1 Tax=Prauserella halophila TaxID=185641 RepID=A0ABN1VX21_9PSEU|nr:VanW family protein [Prauserella halophila]MCP2234593.1 Vancomycin resistance protein YoaR, contains peptidoglycan-binding and VanW domains [Prauserella halophila]
MPQEPRWPEPSESQPNEWPESHTEQTDILPAVPPANTESTESATESTQFISEYGAAETTQHIAWPEADAETTQQVPGPAAGSGDDTVVAAAANAPTAPATPAPDTAGETTQYIPAVPADDPTGPSPDDTGGAAPGGTRGAALGRARTPLLVAAAVLGVLALVYVADVFATSGDVPRGTVVASVDVGGMNRSDAEDKLRSELEPRMTQPVQYRAGDVDNEFDPQQAGLRLNWKETLDRAGDQPLNPFSRIASLFTEREVDVATETERNQLENALVTVQETVDRDPVEGSIAFEGATPKAVEPKDGQKLDVTAAENVIVQDWADGERIELPVSSTPVSVSSEDVQAMLRDVAEPAVSAPVLVRGDDADGTLEPEEIAAALSFEPDNGELTPKIDRKKMAAGVKEELSSTVQEGRDAEIVFKDGSPTVKPSKEGKRIKWKDTFEPLMDVLRSQDEREITAEYEKQQAEITTKQAKQLGIKEVIGEFTTGGFAADSGVNIRRVAEEVDGAIVKPGETFSLNQHTGPRTQAQGYVEAGIIKNGAPGTAVGGGISQFATTLYNASYFAGMTDAGHQEHSYYISRYPEGREATVFQKPNGASLIDLAFTNNLPNGVAIQTQWTKNDITIKLWGTKKYDVKSRTGDRSNVVDPETKDGPDGDECSPSSGAPGFTVTNTRVLRDLDSGSVEREDRTVKYNPQPKIVCKNNRPE